MVTDPSAPKLGLLTKFLYGTGSIGYGIKDVAFRSFLLLYYNPVSYTHLTLPTKA